jgi:hypothetical protein
MARQASKNTQRERAEAERARLYAARKRWHESLISRRTRDNTIAGVAGGLLIVAALVSQSVHAVTNAPEPAPTETSTPTPLENPFSSLFPGSAETPAP